MTIPNADDSEGGRPWSIFFLMNLQLPKPAIFINLTYLNITKINLNIYSQEYKNTQILLQNFLKFLVLIKININIFSRIQKYFNTGLLSPQIRSFDSDSRRCKRTGRTLKFAPKMRKIHSSVTKGPLNEVFLKKKIVRGGG